MLHYKKNSNEVLINKTTLNHIQDLFDTISHILIRKVDQNNKKKNKFLSFFSSIGNSYYKKYSNIQKESEYDDDN